MADMIFDGSTLMWNGSSWKATSGPFGKGRLPPGIYDVRRRNITPLTSDIGASYRGSSGKGFFLPITPRDDIGRDGLGIHPDGGVPGTKGCIGIESDAGSFYAMVEKAPAGAALTLEVKY